MAQKPPLLFIGAYPEPAAIARYVSGDLALHLQTKGWRYQLASRKKSRLGRILDISAKILSARDEYEVVCADVFSGPAFVWAELACWLLRILKKPYVLTLHGGSLPEFANANPGRVRRLLSSAAVVTSPSAYLISELKEHFTGIQLIPNPIDVRSYPYKQPASRLQKLIWLRSFHSIYNPEMAVDLVSILRKSGHEVSLEMYGPDKGDGSLQRTQARARELGVTDWISFKGMVAKEQVSSVLAAGDVFVNTTNFDNTPVSVLEALAAGLPVVTTRVGGIPYLLKDGFTAVLTPAGDASAMADGIRRLITQPEFAQRLSRQGRELVEGFDWGVVLPQWETLLEKMGR